MVYKDPQDPRMLEKRRAHYHANKQPYLDRAKAGKIEMAKWIRKLKSDPCTDCGESYPYYVMDWDHVDENKEFNINLALRRGYGKKRILAEIAKCELVCSNCHRIRTWTRHKILTEAAAGAAEGL